MFQNGLWGQTIPLLVPKQIQNKSLSKIVPKLPALLDAKLDSMRRDSIQLSINEDLKSEVIYTSKDSSVTDVDGKVLHLYGDAKVVYGSITLTAEYIRVNWATNEIFAQAKMDTATKKLKGRPIFEDNGEKYDSDEIRYNFKTKKGLIKQIVTKQGDGNVRGSTVKKDEEDNLYIGGQPGAIYTTCNLPTPHFHIAAKKIKLVKDKQVISGPFNLVLAGIPTPLGLPFGFFPIPKKKQIGTSGIIMPQYGEEPNGRGFYLSNGGYYFAISEKVNLTLTGQYYTNGSWGVGALVPYSVKYRYNGSFNINVNINKTGDEVSANNQPKTDLRLTWNHSPIPRGKSSFSASVNIGSNSYNQRNSFEVQQYTKNQANSSVQYSRTFGQYANLSTNVRVNQVFPADRNARDASGNLKDPGTTEVGWDYTLGINQISPFALKGGSGRWYESFRLGASVNGGYSFNNTINANFDNNNQRRSYVDTAGIGFPIVLDTTNILSSKLKPIGANTFRITTVDDLSKLLRDPQFRTQYTIPISLPNIKLMRYINITPGISLSGVLYRRNFKYDYDSTSRKVIVSEESKATFVNQVSFSAGVNSRVYGTYWIRGKRLEAIRHTLIPSLGFSYIPDQSASYQLVQVGVTKDGKKDTRYLNKYNTVGGPQGGIGKSSASMSWSLNNLFEAKIRPKSDSSGKQFEKKSLLNNFSINGSYDFTRDSLRASDVSVSANTQLSKNISFNFNSSFDPYTYRKVTSFGDVGEKINAFSLKNLTRITSANIGINARFAPKAAEKPKKSKEGTEQQLKEINQNPNMYVDFSIPWTVNLAYNFGYSQPGLAKSQTTMTTQVNGDFSLTPKLKFVYTSGYDFASKSISFTNIAITRDLHCWEMTFNWTPFAAQGSGRGGNYSFNLRVKSALLKDLKLSRNRSFYDSRTY